MHILTQNQCPHPLTFPLCPQTYLGFPILKKKKRKREREAFTEFCGAGGINYWAAVVPAGAVIYSLCGDAVAALAVRCLPSLIGFQLACLGVFVEMFCRGPGDS